MRPIKLVSSAYFVYILECGDGTLYTGCTNNIEKRIITHEQGRGAKYVRARLPVKLVYSEMFSTRSEALKREIEIKNWPRTRKLELIMRA